jgi:competence protein ComEA
MKQWHYTLLVFLVGMIASAALFLVASPPRGTAVELLPAPTPAPIVIDVDGAVLRPGVYSLPRESRVQDAIQAAGGLSQTANQNAVNLATRLKDGDKLTIPALGTPFAIEPATPPATRSKAVDPSLATPGALVNLNTASLEELQTLPGIGPTKAQQIIDYRQAHGVFKTIDELQNVTGIGPATFEQLRSFVTVN